MKQTASKRMTEGPIAKQLITFALPLFLGNLFQQLYNVADTLIVGQLLGNTALAAVSSTGSLVMLLVGLFAGVAMGGSVVISRYFGAQDMERTKIAIHTSMAFGVITGVLISVIGTVFAPQILVWMDTPAEVMADSVAYIRVFFAGAIGMVLYNTCMGIMRSVGDSKHPLQYLIVSSILNVVLDIIMIAVFGMGVEGAALATVISQLFSVFLCMYRLLRVDDVYRIYWKEIRIHWATLRQVISYGIPSGIQNSVTAFANVVVQTNINSFGEMAMAGCGAYSRVEGFAFTVITSFCMAITTFVGQNLGAREYERVKRGARFVIIASMLMAELIGVILAVGAPVFIAAFTEEAEAIAFGVERARTCSWFFFLLAYTHSVSAVLGGAGRAAAPMFAMMGCWCVFRVAFLTVVVPMVQDIAVVNWVYPLTWILSSVVLLIYYIKSDWLHSFEKEGKAISPQ